MRKIAFCFLIYDVINHEELWNRFFENVDKSKYSIYIHYKDATPLTYFDNYKLETQVETEYADVSIVKAQNLLLEEARKDEENQHFIFISNSCIPLKNFNHIYDSLLVDKSYFNMAPQCDCFPKCEDTLEYIERMYIQKASQWCILCRNHVDLVLSSDEYLKWFDYSLTAPDEQCYISYIYYNKRHNELITTLNESVNATTFTNWEGMNYKYPSTDELKNYEEISEEELQYLLDSDSLFGRKFKVECYEYLNKDFYLEKITS